MLFANLLKECIERELSKIREEIKHIMKRLKQKITALSDEILTTDHLRVFLSHLTMRFHKLIFLTLDDNYFDSDTIFFDDSNVEHYSKRIRALIHRLNTKFSNRMRENDQKRKIITSRSEHRDEPKKSVEENQILMTKQKMKDCVKICCLSRVLTISDSQSDLRQQQRKRVVKQLQSCSHV